MIDRKALDSLQDMIGGNHADLADLIGEFLAEAPGQVAVIADPAADVGAMRRAAHTMKSNLRDLGAIELADLCARLEHDLLNGGNPASARPLADEFMRQWPAVRTALEAEMGGKAS